MAHPERNAPVGKHGGPRQRGHAPGGGRYRWRLGWRGLLGAALAVPALALAPVGVALAASPACTIGATVTCTYSYTGGAQTWTVPAGVTQATVTLYGAEGGQVTTTPGGGGLGAQVVATLPVSAGTTYQVNVGQAGFLNGVAGFGGGGIGNGDSASGGGASDLRSPASDGTYPLANRLLVAGGGGGSGEGDTNGDPLAVGGNADQPGGNGGSTSGYGTSLSGGGGGKAGTANSGGAGGAGGAVTGVSTCTEDGMVQDAVPGRSGSAGLLGSGGGGASGSSGGGGGGGYYGGGGGGSGPGDVCIRSGGGGGGGGSSFTGGVSGATVTDGVKAPGDAPNGEIIVTYAVPLDTTPPTASPTQSPAANAAGWNNSAVTVTWNWTDNPGGSGIDPNNCTTQSTSSGEGTITLSASCQDLAGNKATASDTVKVDLTPPEVRVTGVDNGAAYTLGAVPAAGCATTDALSGVATPAALSISGGNADGTGTFTATCAGATDIAGNAAAPVSASYSVNYAFSGYQAPIANAPTVNSGHEGRTYPVKFQLTDASGAFISNLAAVQAITYQGTGCSAFASAPTDTLTTTATGGTSLRYDSTANQYVYNWATPATGGCYTLFLTLDSGQVFSADFNLQ